MKIQSLYYVQSSVLSLNDDTPFNHNKGIRKSFRPIFDSKQCFAEMGPAIYDYYRVNENDILEYWNNVNEILEESDYARIPVTDAPFIADMGQVCFNTRSMYFIDSAYKKQAFAAQLAKRITYWRNFSQTYTNPDFSNHFTESGTFGYDINLEDQRMNFLYFELRPGFKIAAFNEASEQVASGKIYIHIYPSGYVVLHIAARFRNALEADNKEEINKSLEELKPWKNGVWKWKSKFGTLSLKETVERIYEKISISIFDDGTILKANQNWKASALIKADIYENEDELTKFIPNLDKSEQGKDYYAIKCNSNGFGMKEYFVADKNISYYFADARRNSKNIMHSFWKMMHINEFILCKMKIYGEYTDFSRRETNRIKILRLDPNKKFSVENVFGKNFYDSNVISYLSFLDQIVHSLNPKNRALYSYISETSGFSEKRKALKPILSDWEREIEKWGSKEKVIHMLPFQQLQKLIKFLFP